MVSSDVQVDVAGAPWAVIAKDSTSGAPPNLIDNEHERGAFSSDAAVDALDLHPDDIYWCTADPGWVTGTSYGVVAPLVRGVTSVVDMGELDSVRCYAVLGSQQVMVWYTAGALSHPPAQHEIVRFLTTCRLSTVRRCARHERHEGVAAASGYVVLVLGAAGAALERGAPPRGASGGEVAVFFARYRVELLAQSLLFVLAGAANLWFLAGLRGYLHRAEGGSGVLTTLAFAAGVTGVAVGALIHAPQVALAERAGAGVAPEVAGIIADLGYALSLIALVPIAVMLAAVAVVALRAGAFPAWLGWLSMAGAVAHVVGWFGVIVDSGPLTPGGWFTYVPYALWMVWLVAVATIMVTRLHPTTHVPVGP